MKKKLLIMIIFLLLVIGLPLAGVVLWGGNIGKYLKFPPETQYIQQPPFSWIAFFVIVTIILFFTIPFIIRIVTAPRIKKTTVKQYSFPWWGRIALIFGIFIWVIAWTRFEMFSCVQRWTFTPLWFSYIVVINALLYKRTGTCLLKDRLFLFLILFPVSATFWWFFEFLNRFVNNWFYVGVENLSATQYILEASLAFSTVLPAVVSTKHLLKSYPNLTKGLDNFKLISIPNKGIRFLSVLVFLLSCTGLLGIAFLPDVLFPLLWVAPLLIMVTLSSLFKKDTIFRLCLVNDYRPLVQYAFAGLICGFFWEMWNMYSLAKWIYSVPYVHVFKIFEMPVLGFAGYLPFGLECAVITHMLYNKQGDLL